MRMPIPLHAVAPRARVLTARRSPTKALHAVSKPLRQAILDPYQRTSQSQEFKVATMLLFGFGLLTNRRNPMELAIRSGLFFGHDIINGVLAGHPVWQGRANVACTIAQVLRSPTGLAAGMLGCALGDALAERAPEPLRNTMRTAGFLGGVLYGPAALHTTWQQALAQWKPPPRSPT